MPLFFNTGFLLRGWLGATQQASLSAWAVCCNSLPYKDVTLLCLTCHPGSFTVITFLSFYCSTRLRYPPAYACLLEDGRRGGSEEGREGKRERNKEGLGHRAASHLAGNMKEKRKR